MALFAKEIVVTRLRAYTIAGVVGLLAASVLTAAGTGKAQPWAQRFTGEEATGKPESAARSASKPKQH